MDALQGGPVASAAASQHGVDGAAHVLERRAPRRRRPRSGRASRRRSSSACSWRGRLGAERLGEGAVHLGGGLARARGPARRSRCRPPRRAARPARRPRRPGRNSWAKARCPDAGWSPLGARVRPVPGRPTRRPRAPGASRRRRARPGATTSGFSPGESIRKTLTMSGVWWPSGRSQSRMTEVLDCSPDEHPRGAHVHLGAPARLRHTDDRLVDGSGRRRRRGLHPALDELEQLGGVDRVVRAVVDPPAAEHRVLHGADEGVVGAAERLAAVGERHLVDDRLGAGLVGHDERLDPHLARPGRRAASAASRRSRGCWPFAAYQRCSPIQPGTSSTLVGLQGRGGVDLSHGRHRVAAPAPARRSRATRG